MTVCIIYRQAKTDVVLRVFISERAHADITKKKQVKNQLTEKTCLGILTPSLFPVTAPELFYKAFIFIAFARQRAGFVFSFW